MRIGFLVFGEMGGAVAIKGEETVAQGIVVLFIADEGVGVREIPVSAAVRFERGGEKEWEE